MENVLHTKIEASLLPAFSKILSTKAGYTTMVRIASLSIYFVSLLCILGVFHLVKYFAVKKLEAEKCDKR